VLQVTLDRPEVRNALDAEAFDQLGAAFVDAAADRSVGSVVLAGAGGTFCAGADLRSLGSNGGDARGPSAAEVIERFPKPILAAVDGAAVGFGFTMLLLCDLVVVSRDARLAAPFVRLGIGPDAGSSMLLPERVGWQQASLALYTGDWIDAETAVTTGIALRSEPPEDVLATTLDLAGRIAAMPGEAIVETKRLLLLGRRGACEVARREEGLAFDRLRTNRPGPPLTVPDPGAGVVRPTSG